MLGECSFSIIDFVRFAESVGYIIKHLSAIFTDILENLFKGLYD